MMRRIVNSRPVGLRMFCLVVSAMAAFLPVVDARAAESTVLPNVVLVMADDQGWGDVGYYGNPVLKTPVLDEMAGAGLRLDRFYAAAPVCSPTRGSVMTGRHPGRFACFSWGAHASAPGNHRCRGPQDGRARSPSDSPKRSCSADRPGSTAPSSSTAPAARSRAMPDSRSSTWPPTRRSSTTSPRSTPSV